MGRWPKEVTPIVLLEWRFYLMPSSLALLFYSQTKRRSFFCSYIVMVTGVGPLFLMLVRCRCCSQLPVYDSTNLNLTEIFTKFKVQIQVF